MRTTKGIEIENKFEELIQKFEKFLRPLFEEWKREIPKQIQEKIACPLFRINIDKTIDLNFAKEVIILYLNIF